MKPFKVLACLATLTLGVVLFADTPEPLAARKKGDPILIAEGLRDLPGTTNGTFIIPSISTNRAFAYARAIPTQTNAPAEGGTNVWTGPKPPPLPLQIRFTTNSSRLFTDVDIDDPILVKLGPDSYELIAGTNDNFRVKHKPEIRKLKDGRWLIRFP